jgi:hypothetical protein
MPITSLVSVQRMAQLSGYAVPDDIVRRIEAGGDDRAEIRKRGIEVATELCRDLLEAGVPGLHFYTLNFSKATREIYENLGLVAQHQTSRPPGRAHQPPTALPERHAHRHRRVVKAGRTIGPAECDVTDTDGRLVSEPEHLHDAPWRSRRGPLEEAARSRAIGSVVAAPSRTPRAW